MKKVTLDKKGHYRFYHPLYPQIKGTAPTFTLHNVVEICMRDNQPYPFLNIQTEKQLAKFLLDYYGEGVYSIHAHLKGKKGCYIFWCGEVNRSGWIFYQHQYDRKEIDELQKELHKTETEQERYEVEDMINSFKEMAKEEVKIKRYGFTPFLLPSGKRGEWHGWDEEQLPSFRVKVKGDVRTMTVDEINEF